MGSALFFSLLLAAATERTDLTGTITDIDGKPVWGASIQIYEATLRHGTNRCSAHAYPDCEKSVVSDTDGYFCVPSLDPRLVFRVLILAEGYDPLFAELVDPAAGPLKVTVMRRPVQEIDLQCLIHGRVMDNQNRPVAGATLTLVNGRTVGRWDTRSSAIDACIVTNRTGEFVITATRPIQYAVFRVQARGLATRLSPRLMPDRFSQIVTLGPGSTVTGRIVHQGQPVAGVVVGVCHADRRPARTVGRLEIATDKEGRFCIENVPRRRNYYVYAKMRSLKRLGALPVQPLEVDGSGDAIALDDLHVQPGHRIAGQVLLAGQLPLPADTRLIISSTTTGDVQSIPLPADGQFSATGLPASGYTVRVKLPGYCLAPENRSIDPYNPLLLRGQLASDIANLTISLQPDDRLPSERLPPVRWTLDKWTLIKWTVDRWQRPVRETPVVALPGTPQPAVIAPLVGIAPQIIAASQLRP